MSRLFSIGMILFGLLATFSSCEQKSPSFEFIDLSKNQIDILFVSETEGLKEIFGVIDSLPHKVINLGGYLGSYGALDPTWAKNGRQYAFTDLFVQGSTGPFHTNIYIRNMDSASTDLTPLTYFQYYLDSTGLPHGTVSAQPDWCQSTNKIVFISKSDLQPAYSIFTVNVTDTLTGDTILYRLTDSLGSDKINFYCYPSWSPDGSKIVYTSTKSGNEEIWRMDSNGTNKTQLTHLNVAFAGRPRYSPSGDKISFYASVHASATDSSIQIFIMNPDGSGIQQLTTSGNNVDPAWSPDGNFIIYSKQTSSNGYIYMIGRDGQNDHQFISDEKAAYPIWRPNTP